jgi:hypothetical protein
LPLPHSSFFVQLERHAVGPHTYGAHAFDAGLQVPAPSHVLTCTSTLPPHEGFPQTEVVPGYLQILPSVPSQRDAQALSVDVPVHAGWPVSGSPTMGTHFPIEPALLQASQDPLHALSQHTPSAHTPLAHSAFAEHAVPLRLTHTPLSVPVPALHERPGPQDPTAQHTVSVQKPLVQVSAVVQDVPRPSIGTHAPVLQ